MITMKDIALLAGVSTATVSKIINGNDKYISEDTRERVNKVIRETNYVPNAVAKGLKIKQSRTLGFILPDISNPYFPEIARGIEDAAGSLGFSVMFCNTDNDVNREAEAISFLQSKMVDGIIVTRTAPESRVAEYSKKETPFVVVDSKSSTAKNDVGEVIIDSKAAFTDITKLMLKKGCKKLAFISASGEYDRERYEGFSAALNECGLEAEESLIYRENYDVKTGYDGVEHIFENNFADGIVCGNDLIAVGVVDALRKKGLSVPEDVKVSGFDDIYFSRYLNPALTTVKQPAYEMGAAAAKMLINFILNSEPLHSIKFPYQLIEREST